MVEQMFSNVPEIGQLAIVRKRPFVITEIVPSAPGLGGELSKPSHLVKLSSVEDDGLGEELQVIWEIEPGTAIHEKPSLPEPDSFDHPKHLQAFLDAVRCGGVPFLKRMTAPSNHPSAVGLKWTSTSLTRWFGPCPCLGSIC